MDIVTIAAVLLIVLGLGLGAYMLLKKKGASPVLQLPAPVKIGAASASTSAGLQKIGPPALNSNIPAQKPMINPPFMAQSSKEKPLILMDLQEELPAKDKGREPEEPAPAIDVEKLAEVGKILIMGVSGGTKVTGKVVAGEVRLKDCIVSPDGKKARIMGLSSKDGTPINIIAQGADFIATAPDLSEGDIAVGHVLAVQRIPEETLRIVNPELPQLRLAEALQPSVQSSMPKSQAQPICKSCNKENEHGSRFCMFCGKPLR